MGRTRIAAIPFLLALAGPAQADEEREKDLEFAALTFEGEVNTGSFTPNRDDPERADYRFRNIYVPVFRGVYVNRRSFLRLSGYIGSILTQLAVDLRSTETAPGTPVPGTGLREVTLFRGVFPLPTVETARLFRLGPGKFGLGAYLDVVGFPDGEPWNNTFGFEFGPNGVYLFRIGAARFIGSAAFALIKLTHPTSMSGGALHTKLDALIPFSKKWCFVGGGGWESIGIHRGDRTDQDVLITDFNFRLGFAACSM
jgi:hypothetical protein